MPWCILEVPLQNNLAVPRALPNITHIAKECPLGVYLIDFVQFIMMIQDNYEQIMKKTRTCLCHTTKEVKIN